VFELIEVVLYPSRSDLACVRRVVVFICLIDFCPLPGCVRRVRHRVALLTVVVVTSLI
jgi:hypothetical protein